MTTNEIILAVPTTAGDWTFATYAFKGIAFGITIRLTGLIVRFLWYLKHHHRDQL